MKILFICHRLPYPPNRGGKIRPFHMIRHLARDHSVVVASLAATEEERRQGHGLGQYATEVLADVVPPRTRWRRAVAALPTPTPSSVAYFWSPRLRQDVVDAARRHRFDAVIVHCAFVAGYAADIAAPLRLLDFGDLDSWKWAAYARHRARPLAWGYALESEKLRAWERRQAGLFDQVTVTTRAEHDAYLSLGVSRRATVVPNGVDTTRFAGAADPPPGSATIVFLGRMDYFPNIDGVTFFAREVFPLVKRQVPAATFRIIGANPGPSVRRLAATPGIEVTGTVPDVRPCLRDAAVSVAPLRIARGTQNKILESMAAGLPVVASPAAASGLQAIPDRHLLVAGDAPGFAAAVVDLLENAERRQQLCAAANACVLPAHDWTRSMGLLDDLLVARP